MVEIKKIFSDSFNLLLHNKKIIIPILLSIVFSLILGSLFLNLSGLNPLLKEIRSASTEFDNQKTDYLTNTSNISGGNYSSELITYLSKGSSNSPYNKEFSGYLKEKGFEWSNYKQLLNSRNLALLVIFIVVHIIGLFYFYCMTYAMIALAIHKKDNGFKNVIKITNNFLFQFLWLGILLTLIVIVPIAILIGITVFFYSFSKILSVLSGLIFFILIMVYMIFIALRLFFATPAMYIDQKNAVDSIKHSFQITKGCIGQVIIIFFIIIGITIFSNTFINQPLSSIYSNVMFSSNWIKISISSILVLFFIILKSFAFAFEHTFLFYSYIDFKRIGGANKMVNNYLINYIKEQLKNGYDINSIREAITQQGYERGEIEDSINYANSNAKNITEKESNKTAGVNITNPNYQGFWIRFLAYMLDGIIIGIPAWILQIGLLYVTKMPSMMYLALLVAMVFVVYMDGIKGGTPGKLILGMRIVNEKGEYIGIPMAILRYIGKVLSGIILYIGYFMIGWDEKKQGLHDKIAQTYVVKV